MKLRFQKKVSLTPFERKFKRTSFTHSIVTIFSFCVSYNCYKFNYDVIYVARDINI